MRILFMGTPDLAAESLGALIAAGHEIVGVFTRADKPVGRKQVLTAPPVKQLAVQHGIPVWQPATLRDGEAEKVFRALQPDLVVVVAYGRILPPALLHIAPLGCINLHVSLLPKYRGSAPIQWAVLNGDKETGVTIMQLDEGCDTGDILLVEPVAIGPETTSGELFDEVSAIGAKTLVRAVELLGAGQLRPRPQDSALATQAPPLTKEMARFTFAETAAHLHNWVRGMNPWPVAFFEQDGKKIKVLASRTAENPAHAAPGTILSLKPLTVACAEGALQLLTVTPEGGRPMEGTAWAAGRRLHAGDSLLPRAISLCGRCSTRNRPDTPTLCWTPNCAVAPRRCPRGRRRLPPASSIRYWSAGICLTGCLAATSKSRSRNWTRRYARSCAPGWRRPALWRCRCRPPSTNRSS